MPMTITEKILARHAGRDEVAPGELILAKADIGMANDITGPIAIREFEASGAARVFDPEKIVLVMDHFVPAKDILSATQIKISRDFARKHNLPHFYDAG
ncbi:MAG TPA: 3-isopropylmalate dehydratase large subunit, partial [Thermodesulfobacteriota bacterium]|nr:3-isopropylmalate dehydratase large subunit [Thermodesulfobacteriota bacterium]